MLARALALVLVCQSALAQPADELLTELLNRDRTRNFAVLDGELNDGPVTALFGDLEKGSSLDLYGTAKQFIRTYGAILPRGPHAELPLAARPEAPVRLRMQGHLGRVDVGAMSPTIDPGPTTASFRRTIACGFYAAPEADFFRLNSVAYFGTLRV